MAEETEEAPVCHRLRRQGGHRYKEVLVYQFLRRQGKHGYGVWSLSLSEETGSGCLSLSTGKFSRGMNTWSASV